jgi:hypothetical protein
MVAPYSGFLARLASTGPAAGETSRARQVTQVYVILVTAGLISARLVMA